MERLPSLGTPSYALTRKLVGGDFDEVVADVTAALATEGFGVLTTIDVAATMDKKLDRTLAPYVILGACNPRLAIEALSQEPGVGTLLPCNVVVAAEPDGIVVSAVDPQVMLSVIGRAGLDTFATEVRRRLVRVLEALH